MSYATFEPGDTKQFTWVASLAPDTAPTLCVYAVNDPTITVIASLTGQSSDSTHYWQLFTMPGSEGFYRAEWRARKTAIGSAFNLINPVVFQVHRNGLPG